MDNGQLQSGENKRHVQEKLIRFYSQLAETSTIQCYEFNRLLFVGSSIFKFYSPNFPSKTG